MLRRLRVRDRALAVVKLVEWRPRSREHVAGYINRIPIFAAPQRVSVADESRSGADILEAEAPWRGLASLDATGKRTLDAITFLSREFKDVRTCFQRRIRWAAFAFIFPTGRQTSRRGQSVVDWSSTYRRQRQFHNEARDSNTSRKGEQQRLKYRPSDHDIISYDVGLPVPLPTEPYESYRSTVLSDRETGLMDQPCVPSLTTNDGWADGIRTPCRPWYSAPVSDQVSDRHHERLIPVLSGMRVHLRTL